MIPTQQSDFRYVTPLGHMACILVQHSGLTRSWPTAA